MINGAKHRKLALNKFLMLYWAFYKSTVILNISVSFAIALLGMVYGGNFFIVFAGSFMSIGLLAASGESAVDNEVKI